MDNDVVIAILPQAEPLTLLVAMAGAPGAFAEDILTRIVNVQWASGLAVEFYPGDT